MFSLLEIFFLISGIGILVVTFFIGKKERFSALHFLVFWGVGIGLIVFTLFPDWLKSIGNIF